MLYEKVVLHDIIYIIIEHVRLAALIRVIQEYDEAVSMYGMGYVLS